MTAPAELRCIETLADRYDLFLFDQYGVLHDGRSAYPGLAGTLAALKRAGRRTAVITNSGRSAADNAERLASFGFGAELIDQVFSSGEFAGRELDALPPGTRVFVVARGDPARLLPATTTLQRVDDAGAAQLLLIGGCEPERYSLDDYADLLAPAIAGGVPALCTNPDLAMLVDGGVGFGPGEIAADYERAGGRVRRIGKPYPALYHAALEATGTAAADTLCIGDSVAHDILGARRAGCASLLVATGVNGGLDAVALASLCTEHGAVPDYRLRKST